jgi:hypothetical protein
MDKLTLAYMKGIIDSEGMWDPVNKRLVVSNTSEELIDWLVKNFGGSVSRQAWSTLTTKQSYQWRPSAREAVALVSILPVLEDMPPECSRAYIAGFVDGDGTIYLHKRIRNGRLQTTPRVIVTNSKSVESIEYIHQIYGGSLSSMNPRPKHREKKPYVYLLIAGKARAGSMIRDMLPFLIIKRAKALEVLNGCLTG